VEEKGQKEHGRCEKDEIVMVGESETQREGEE
jgi:hypothetical protein